MPIFRYLVPAFVAFAVSGCASLPTADPDALTVTEARSLASELNGKEIIVVGYVTDEFENTSIWATPIDADNLSQSHCLGLAVPDSLGNSRLNRRWASLRGRLHVFPKNSISFNACSGVELELLEMPIRVVKPQTLR